MIGVNVKYKWINENVIKILMKESNIENREVKYMNMEFRLLNKLYKWIFNI